MLRRSVMGAEAPVFMGKIALRAVIPAQGLDARYLENVHIWLAPGAHVVHYPVRKAAELALVVIVDGDDESLDWGSPVMAAGVLQKLGRVTLAPSLLDLLGRAETWRQWSLQGLKRPVPFANGRIALLGDSAHPVLPFLAQGAVLALEDAVALVDALRTTGRRKKPSAPMRKSESRVQPASCAPRP